MRPTALPVAVIVTAGLQILLYAADVPAGTATLGAILAGWAAYFVRGPAQQRSGQER